MRVFRVRTHLFTHVYHFVAIAAFTYFLSVMTRIDEVAVDEKTHITYAAV